MRPTVVTVGPLATADADGVCQTQTPGAAGALTINGALASGGVATFDTARRVIATVGSEASQRTLVVTGTDRSGNPISETLTIAASTAGANQTQLDYLTVTSVVAGSAFTAALTVGTNGVASSRPIRLDDYSPSPVTIGVNITGTVNYDVEVCMDDPNSLSDAVAEADMLWYNSADTNVVNATSDQMSYLDRAPLWVRIILNSGTGSLRMTVRQDASPTR